MGNLYTESNFFVADITFSHGLHLLLERPKHPITIATSIITENKTKSKYYFCKIPLNFQIIKGTRTDYQLPGKYSLPDELEEPEEPDELEELEEPEELDEFEELEEPEVPEFFEELLLLLPEAELTVELPPAEELSSSVVMVISIPDKSISLSKSSPALLEELPLSVLLPVSAEAPESVLSDDLLLQPETAKIKINAKTKTVILFNIHFTSLNYTTIIPN